MAAGYSSTNTTLPLATIYHMITIKLSSTNYLLWKNQIIPLLNYQNLIGYVNGTLPPPPSIITIDEKSSPNPDFIIWQEGNQRALLILQSSLTEEVMTKVLGLSTAHSVWRALESAYGHNSVERIQYLRDSLRQLQKGNSTVLEYGRKFKSLCEQLADIGQPVDDSDKTHWFLCGLGPTFETFSTTQRAVKPRLTFHDVVCQAEAHELYLRSMYSSSITPTAFTAPKKAHASWPYFMQSIFADPNAFLPSQPQSRPEQPYASPFMNQLLSPSEVQAHSKLTAATHPLLKANLQPTYNQSHLATLQDQDNLAHVPDYYNVTSLREVHDQTKKSGLDLLRGPDGKLPQKLRNLETRIIEQISNEIMDTDPNIRLDDIAGLHHAKECVTEMVIWPLLRPDIFKGCRSPGKGLLLFGPPGTGKTMIGKAIAGECKATFFYISASSITSKWVGDGEKLVRALFGVAGCHQPAVIFVDEIDSLLSQRNDQEQESTRRIKTQFLIEMEGFNNDSDQILLIGATNRPQDLDEAARRRLSTRLYIPLPSAEARSWIVRNLLNKDGLLKLSTEDIDTICKLTQGYSGSDMKNLVKDASMGPLREALRQGTEITEIKMEDMRPITLQDFEDALKKVRPSVSLNELGRYEDWNNQFGSKIDI